MRLGLDIPFFTQLINRNRRSRLRSVMRGYRILKESNRLGLVRKMMGEVSTRRLSRLGDSVSRLIYGAGLAEAELITRQYLVGHTADLNKLKLSQVLLYSLATKSPVVHPLPWEWQKVLIHHGFTVATGRCSLAFAGFVGMLWVLGMLRIATQILAYLRGLVWPSPGGPRHYAYFFGVTKNNLPQSRHEGVSYDIFSWYARWGGRVRPLESLRHGVRDVEDSSTCGLRVEFMPRPIPQIGTLAGTCRFVMWAIRAIGISSFDLVRGRWWNALMLSEASLAARVRYQEVETLPKDCLFNNACGVYRPLWTYEAERRGARITFCAFSTNNTWIWWSEGAYHSKVSYEWELMSWPLYLAWGKEHAAFIRMAVGHAPAIEIAGPLWYGDSAVELPKLPMRSVAVFDIQPHRSSFHHSRCPPSRFAEPEAVDQFLADIYAVLRESGCTIVHKRKRNIGNLLHPKYAALVRRLLQATGYIAVEADTSALRVIEGCEAVISMPFTSTALYGRHLGKPSIYYYPNSLIQKDDSAATGIPVVCGRDELRDWALGVFGPLTE
ncbi:MAG: polysaccharide biosynthesis PFTS motif protein [Candidatus Omnitrophica bacterium]|nr:polysaccharide biosynthesis PFTS motif protein [Candidatus Omnitrophota bacterium]